MTGALHGAQRRAAEASSQNEALAARFAEAQRIAHVGSREWDVRAGRVRCSEEMLRLLGVARKEFGATGDAFLERVHPDDRERVRALIATAGDTGEPFEAEFRVLRPDSSERVLRARAELTRGRAGDPAAVLGSCLDITVEKTRVELIYFEGCPNVERARANVRAALAAAGLPIAVQEWARDAEGAPARDRPRSLAHRPPAMIHAAADDWMR